MGEQLGKLVTCRRCTESIFLKYTGEVGLSNYAGPGTRATFEELPKTWMDNFTVGPLCPTCAKQLVSLFKDFFGEEGYKQLAPCWKIEEET